MWATPRLPLVNPAASSLGNEVPICRQSLKTHYLSSTARDSRRHLPKLFTTHSYRDNWHPAGCRYKGILITLTHYVTYRQAQFATQPLNTGILEIFIHGTL